MSKGFNRFWFSRGRKLCFISTNKGTVIIDGKDFGKVKNRRWRVCGTGYVYSTDGILLHRLLMGFPAGVDHKNRNPLDNRRFSNLRIASRHENNMNRRGNLNHTSLYKGVSLISSSGRWRAKITNIHLGVFSSEEKAARVYNEAAKLYFCEFAFINRGV